MFNMRTALVLAVLVTCLLAELAWGQARSTKSARTIANVTAAAQHESSFSRELQAALQRGDQAGAARACGEACDVLVFDGDEMKNVGEPHYVCYGGNCACANAPTCTAMILSCAESTMSCTDFGCNCKDEDGDLTTNMAPDN